MPEATPTRVLVAAQAAGPVLRLDEPVSFWGGLDPSDGTIIDRRHPQAGVAVGGTVLVMHAGRGSSSGSSVLAEAIRRGTGPVAIVLAEPDEIVTIGAVVADELYGAPPAVVVAPDVVFAELTTGRHASITDDGRLSITDRPPVRRATTAR